jgi:hypothetical protein
MFKKIKSTGCSCCHSIEKDESLATALCEWWKYEAWPRVPFKIREAIDSIYFWLFPQNKWATRCIPNRWADKDWLIEKLIFAAIIDYVEVEKGIDRVVFSSEHEEKIMEAYHWAKTGRASMKEQIDQTWPNITSENLLANSLLTKEEYQKCFAQVHELKRQYAMIEEAHLRWLFENRKLLFV